jgi:hypothetical protein
MLQSLIILMAKIILFKLKGNKKIMHKKPGYYPGFLC